MDQEKKLEIKPAQVVAGALGAVTAAVLGAKLNLAGTVVGAAVASVVSTVGAALYQHSIERTRVRWAAAGLSAALVFVVGVAAFGSAEQVRGTAVPSQAPATDARTPVPDRVEAPESTTSTTTTAPSTTTTTGSSVAPTTTPPPSTTTPTTTESSSASPTQGSGVHTPGP
ncbi:hypothetical protein DFJ66_4382 [Saccharothrix variisporea]|uniref:Uncharacterized protein n=1 Tax=Saccharothrix variisporea TaxID=543527 RepID=A0A495XE57_9PSEU|nr:hypothetical protein DFJ66_4382 [Saccharothrix variisporea]